MALRVVVVGLVVLLSAGCVSVPTGPTVMVMPGPDKSFDQFQTDDAVCRQWALQQAGGQPQTAFAQGTATGAAIGTVVGAGLGAAIGAAAGHPAAGAWAGRWSAPMRASRRASRVSAATTGPTSSACTPRATISRARGQRRHRLRDASARQILAGCYCASAPPSMTSS